MEGYYSQCRYKFDPLEPEIMGELNKQTNLHSTTNIRTSCDRSPRYVPKQSQ